MRPLCAFVVSEENFARMPVHVERGVAVALAGQHAMQQHVDAAADVASHRRIVERRTLELAQRRADRRGDVGRGIDQRAVEIEQDRAHAGKELHARSGRLRVLRRDAFERDRPDRRRAPGAAERLEARLADFARRGDRRLEELARIELAIGSLASARRIAPVIARRMSVSMLTLRTPCLMPSTIASTGTP